MARFIFLVASVAYLVLLAPCSGSESTSGECNEDTEPTESNGELVCGQNEILDKCPSKCASDYCPRSEAESRLTQSCPTPNPCPKPACKCQFNYKRTNNGTCIPTRDCPPFTCHGLNEEFNPCPPLCPSDNCSQASPTGECPLPGRIGIVLQCQPKCRCKKGFWRLNNICVPYGKCPGVCPKREVYSDCINMIQRTLNCSQVEDGHYPSSTPKKPCVKGCVCQSPYVRANNGTCVMKHQCDKPKPTCGKNEEYSTCSNAVCRAQNCTQKGQPVACPAVSSCEKGCVCKQDYLRDINGTCIPEDQCPTCGKNEEYSTCSNAVCRAQNCTQKGLPVACPAVSSCEQGCVCKQDYLRDINGTCIPEDQCPLVCNANENLVTCPVDCASDRCPRSADEDQSCPASTTDDCRPSECKCGFNYRRADNDTCIPTRDCPPFDCSARPNEEYNPCPPLCPTDDCSQASPSGRCPAIFGNILIVLPCTPACRCIKNYWRKNGTCVPYGECPNICPANEVYTECISGVCRALNCTQKGQDIVCPDVRDGACEQGCVCAENYLRDNNGTCVPEDQCGVTQLECGDNEVVDKCPTDCPSDYCPKSEADSLASCSKPDPCPEPRCKCRPNYRRAENGTCIPTRECPPFDCSAQPNQTYNSCPAYCPGEDCSQATPTGACPKSIGRIGITLICKPKCTCIKNYWKLNGTCVPYGQCPGVCPKNEVYSDCKKTCPPDTCVSLVARYDCTHEPKCQPGCTCESGFLRPNITEPCVPICECEQMKGSAQCSNQSTTDY